MRHDVWQSEVIPERPGKTCCYLFAVWVEVTQDQKNKALLARLLEPLDHLPTWRQTGIAPARGAGDAVFIGNQLNMLSDRVFLHKDLDMVRLAPQNIASVSPQKVRRLIFYEISRGLIGLNHADGFQFIL